MHQQSNARAERRTSPQPNLTCKIWICTNHRPRVHDDTWSFWRRVRLIPFEVTFNADRADPHLVESLKMQAEGILAWAVRGCLEWQREGLRSPEAVRSATEEYEREADPLSQFLAERCVVHPNAKVRAADLYAAYRDWAAENGLSQKETLSQNAFGRRMSRRFGKDRESAAPRHLRYLGIGLM